MTAGEIAEKVVRAVERNRFYVIPQPSAKFSWLMKRMSPENFYGFFKWLNASERGRKTFMWMARNGMMG
jgi:hypothetical protein